jgi:ubiquinone/menaquinone biosynthesis C-methylase UbiE
MKLRFIQSYTQNIILKVSMVNPIPDYKNLDLSGEALKAAARMEARAQEAASREMFQQLVAPLLAPQVRTVLEFGCGTASLSRRIAQSAPQSRVVATDKSEGMLTVARHLVDTEHIANLRLQLWDVLDEAAFPFPGTQFDLIVSSVVIPYLDDTQTMDLVHRLVARLAPGGTLAFIEQDLSTDTLNFPKPEMLRDVLTKDLRNYKRTLALGLRPILREAGLQVLPRRSFLWTDDAYGAYTRELLETFADAACQRGQIKPEERDEWKTTLDNLAESGDFYYGIVYHLVAGRRE